MLRYIAEALVLIPFNFIDENVAKKVKDTKNTSALGEALFAVYFNLDIRDDIYAGRQRKAMLEDIRKRLRGTSANIHQTTTRLIKVTDKTRPAKTYEAGSSVCPACGAVKDSSGFCPTANCKGYI